MELNKEEIDKLKRFISKLEKPEGHSHFAQTGKYSFSLSASKIQFSSPWIIDSGASDHMANSSKAFSNYIPCPGNQKIKIVDGTLVTVAGSGDVFLTSSLTSRNVLHVPKLSVNLLSIPQITKDLNCSVNFTQSEYSFHDLLTGKVIGHATEEGGLFLLEAESGTTCPTPYTYLSKHHTPTEEQVWLSHFRLGHPPSLLLKKIVPNMFEKLNVQNFHCDVCEYAKHHECLFL